MTQNIEERTILSKMAEPNMVKVTIDLPSDLVELAESLKIDIGQIIEKRFRDVQGIFP